MLDYNDLYFTSHGVRLGTPPRPLENEPKGYQSNAKLLGHLHKPEKYCSNLKRTAWNEITYDLYASKYVVFNRTTIIEKRLSDTQLIINTGGWNTHTYREHIQNALRRLGYDATVRPEIQIRGISVSIPEITGSRGVFFRVRGEFDFAREVFKSDLGYSQELGGIKNDVVDDDSTPPKLYTAKEFIDMKNIRPIGQRIGD